MTDISRRSLITGLISLVAAPAIVRAGSLMPVRTMLIVPEVVASHVIDCWLGSYTLRFYVDDDGKVTIGRWEPVP